MPSCPDSFKQDTALGSDGAQKMIPQSTLPWPAGHSELNVPRSPQNQSLVLFLLLPFAPQGWPWKLEFQAGEMVGLVRCCPCKLEVLSCVPRTHVKPMLGVVVHACILPLKSWRQADPQDPQASQPKQNR